jgi:uncharacterized membrane protein
MDVQAPVRVGGGTTPRATKLALVATIAVTTGALAFFVGAGREHAGAVLVLLTILFLMRVSGQLLVLARRPRWLPQMTDWNLMPYPLLLPLQAVLLMVMITICARALQGAELPAFGGVALSFVYWAALAVRYAVRMARRPEQRWFGGTVPIVFHCVLATFLFVLGSYDAPD